MRRKNTRAAAKAPPEKAAKEEKSPKKARRHSKRHKPTSSESESEEDAASVASSEVAAPAGGGGELWTVTQTDPANNDIGKLKICLARPSPATPERTERASKRLRGKPATVAAAAAVAEEAPPEERPAARRTRRGRGGSSPVKQEELLPPEACEEKRGKGKSKGKHKSKIVERAARVVEPTEMQSENVSENVQVTAQSPQNVDNSDAEIVERDSNRFEDESSIAKSGDNQDTHDNVVDVSNNDVSNNNVADECRADAEAEARERTSREEACNDSVDRSEMSLLNDSDVSMQEVSRFYATNNDSQTDADEAATVEVKAELKTEPNDVEGDETPVKKDIKKQEEVEEVKNEEALKSEEEVREEETLPTAPKVDEEVVEKVEEMCKQEDSKALVASDESGDGSGRIRQKIEAESVESEDIKEQTVADEEEQVASEAEQEKQEHEDNKDDDDDDALQPISRESRDEAMEMHASQIEECEDNSSAASSRWCWGETGASPDVPIVSVDRLAKMLPALAMADESAMQLDHRAGPRERAQRQNDVVGVAHDEKQQPGAQFAREHCAPSSASARADASSLALHRKISIVADEASSLRPPPSPARREKSSVLFITNLVRPFTAKQLRGLLERTGTIVEGGFWTDKIKSKCYVQYETDAEAEGTRNAIHGVLWPIGNGKKLIIDYATAADLENAKNPQIVAPPNVEPEKENNEPPKRHNKMAVAQRHEEEERVEEQVDEKDARMRRSRCASVELKRRHAPSRRSRSPSEDIKRKRREEPPQQRAMDDLFRKTDASPSIYWQPLQPEEIALKQQQRLERMEAHQRKMESQTRTRRNSDRQRGPYRRRY